MRVAICDDEKDWATRISVFIYNYYTKMQILCICDEFTSTQKLLTACRSVCYDAVFLDVDMPQNGIDIAAEIRMLSPHTLSVFISSYLKFAKDCFCVKAIGYILKQEMEEFLPERLDALLLELQPPDNTIELYIDGDDSKINLSGVMYFEADEHHVTIYQTNNSPHRKVASITLSKLEQTLYNKPFLRIHKSYLVNMNYIATMKNYKATLKNGVVLPVSEIRFSKVRDAYLLWKGASL